MLCIYCNEDKPKQSFSHREHIIPQCFGSFKDNLILDEMVCNECNQYFGDNLEINMGRDTLEGIARYRYGINPKNPPIFRRLKFMVGNESALKGVHVIPVQPDEQTTSDEIKVLAQVGIYNQRKEIYEYYEKDNIPSKEDLLKRGCLLQDKEIIFYGDIQGLVDEMKNKGYNIDSSKIRIQEEEKPASHIPVHIKARIDKTICRGMAKITFNYLAHHLDRDILMKDDFSIVRRFIRYDEGEMDEFITISKTPIFHKEIVKNRRWHEGHILVIEWIGLNLIGKLALFNSIVKLTYITRICNNYKGIWFPFQSGHYFDLRSGDIKKIHILKLFRID